MRIAGFALLQLAALLFSLRHIGSKKRGAACLASFCAMLEQLGGLLGREAAPMPELIGELIPRSDGAAEVFLRALAASMDRLGEYSFCALWKNALGAAPALSDREAAQALEELGTVLGRYELETQLRAVESCRAVLCRRLDAQRQSLPQTKRLTLGLSLAAAALVGIILI